MAVKILLDPVGNTMNVWWGNQADAAQSVEVDDPHRNDVIVLDKTGKPISVEIIGVFPKELNLSSFVRTLGGKPTEPFLLHS